VTKPIVVLCMGGAGHVQTLLPLVSALASRGCAVQVMTRDDFRDHVERVGGRFVDLYARRPLEAADATSMPFPSRFVTFAATYAESLAEEIGALSPALIVYDTFTVAGPVAARQLRVPYVNVCPNHAPVPARMIEALRRDPRVAISAECRAAVRRLREVHGMSDASPFSYYDALSPYLNVYAEPEEFLRPDERAAFEPIAFFGSLLPPASRGLPVVGAFPPGRYRERVYVSFGTGVWRYFAKVAFAALKAISDAFAERDAAVLMSLGGSDARERVRGELERSNVRIVDYADQWAVLAEADVFITHHGINSTHEAIFHEVPMLSYPFFGDQPALARRCQELGLAVALTAEPQTPVTPEALRATLRRVAEEGNRLAVRLAEARSWELRTIADRPAVLDRILALASSSG
jgi:MGT family glycosyltransferase